MGFKKGQPRDPKAGRKKGTKNKFTFNAEMLARDLGIDPLEICIHIAAGNWEEAGFKEEFIFVEKPDGAVTARPCIMPEMRLAAAKEAARYMYSTKQAVQLSGEVGIKVIIEDYLKKDE